MINEKIYSLRSTTIRNILITCKKHGNILISHNSKDPMGLMYKGDRA